MNILLRGDAKRARDDLLDIALSLPFQTDVNTGFGILAKVYLDALTHINNRQRVRDPNAEGVKEAKQLALDICEETFPGIKNPKAEVERGFRFWDCVSTISLSPIQSPSPQVFLSLFSQNGLSEYVTDEPSSLCLYFPSFSLLLPMRWAIRATASVFFSCAGAASCAECIQTDDEFDIWTGIQLGI